MKRSSPRPTLGLASGAVLMLGLMIARVWSGEAAHQVPAYVGPGEAGAGSSEVAVLAGGCFWGVQGVYQHVKGVSRALSGYTGGSQATAHYRIVGTGETGHAESVQITFDSHQISYAQILQIFFSVVHDPTELNRQGPDVGAQYRSAVFPLNAEQSRIAKDYIAQLNRARVFATAIVTRIEPGKAFYPAEAYHQDFLTHNTQDPYIYYNDLPKIAALKRLFPGRFRSDPVLVLAAQR